MLSLFLVPFLFSLTPKLADNYNNGFGIYYANPSDIVYDDNDEFNFNLSVNSDKIGCSITLDSTYIDLQTGGDFRIFDAGRGYSIRLYNQDYILEDYSYIRIVGVLKTESYYTSYGLTKDTLDYSTSYSLSVRSLFNANKYINSPGEVTLFSGYCSRYNLSDYVNYTELITKISLVTTEVSSRGVYYFSSIKLTHIGGETSLISLGLYNHHYISDGNYRMEKQWNPNSPETLDFNIYLGEFDFTNYNSVMSGASIDVTPNAFDYIFNFIKLSLEPVFSFLNFELFPGFKLGIVLLVPIIIGLIVTVIKLWGSGA